MSKISVPQLAWFGPKMLDLPLPDGWTVKTYDTAGSSKPALAPDQIQAAVTKPIESAPIRELGRNKKEVVIIFDDMSRVTRVAGVVPSVLEELAAAGVPDSRIKFVCALGNHGALSRTDFVKKLGEDVVARFPVFNHCSFENCSYVGTTSAGTRVSINTEVMKSDLKIAIGSVAPHPAAGFSGGAKIILPGVSAIETCQAFHGVARRAQQENWPKKAGGPGNSENNPTYQDAQEAAALAGLDIKIDALVNLWGETTAVFAGAVAAEHAAAIAQAKEHYASERTSGESIIIANTYAKSNESQIGAGVAFGALGPKGGDVVLIANNPDGQVVHYLLGSLGKTTGGPLWHPIALPPHVNRLIVYSEYPDIARQSMFAQSDRIMFTGDWAAVINALEKTHGKKAAVALCPNIEMQYFRAG